MLIMPPCYSCKQLRNTQDLRKKNIEFFFRSQPLQSIADFLNGVLRRVAMVFQDIVHRPSGDARRLAERSNILVLPEYRRTQVVFLYHALPSLLELLYAQALAQQARV